MSLSVIKNNFLIVFLSALLFSFLILSCKDEGTPPVDLPEGYQQDIPWPSLADSPWPIYRGNPQGTSRSKYIGPQLGIVEWERDSLNLTTGLSIGYDNIIYTISEDPFRYVCAIDNYGKFVWKYDSLENYCIDLHTTPIILKDSTIITTSGQGADLLAFKPDGSIKWKLNIGATLFNVGITVGKDGTIYFTDNTSTLHAVSSKGKLLWSIKDLRIGIFGLLALTMSPDSKTLYIQSGVVSLVAFDLENKVIKWTFGNKWLQTYPLVDCKGNIYILTKNSEINNRHSLYCLKPDGSIRWIYEHNNENFTEYETGMAMDYYGNIYFAFDTLYSVSYTGKLNWKKPLGYLNFSPLIVDKAGTVYVQRSDGWTNMLPLAVTKEGNILWEIKESLNSESGRCGALDNNGKWYLSFYHNGDRKIYSIK